MPELDTDIERLAPQKLLEGFSRGKVIRCVVLAVVIHLVVIVALSTRYIYYTWVNPEAAEVRSEAEERNAAGIVDRATAVRSLLTNRIDATGGTNGTTESDAELVKRHGDKPVVKAITGAATPDEIPKAPTPGGLGISLEDTN